MELLARVYSQRRTAIFDYRGGRINYLFRDNGVIYVYEKQCLFERSERRAMNMYHLTAWDLIVMSLLIFVVYFLPTFIALIRRYNDSLGIMALNCLLGWTFVGWVVALIWSLKKPKHRYRDII